MKCDNRQCISWVVRTVGVGLGGSVVRGPKTSNAGVQGSIPGLDIFFYSVFITFGAVDSR